MKMRTLTCQIWYAACFFSLAIALTNCSNRNDLSDAYGNFEATEIIISAEANGILQKFTAEEGQKISKGNVLGQIDTTDLYLKKRQTEAQKRVIASGLTEINTQIRVHEQQLINLEKDRNRLEKLFSDGAATQKQLDDIYGAIDLVKKNISAVQVKERSVREQMEATDRQVDIINESIRKAQIVNPVDGTIIAKYAEPNEMVAQGKPLYKIADLTKMRMKAYISGDMLPGVSVGQKAEILIDDGKDGFRSLEGTVSWISGDAEFTPKIIQTKKERVNLVYAIKVDVVNDGSLKIGMPGEVRFH